MACKINLLFSLAFLSALVSPMRFSIDSSEPQCLTFSGVGNQTLYLVASGKERHQIQCKINQGEKVILQKVSHDFEFTYQYTNNPIDVCISSTDGDSRQISFDFFHQNDPIRKTIEKKDLIIVEEALKDVHEGMLSISRNQQFHIERDESHKNALEDSESKIKWTGIVKILFLLSSALIQLYIMKGFFKSNSNTYQPVEMM